MSCDAEAVGETFVVDALLYTVTAENEVSVGAESTEISGHVTIPSSVENGGVTYAVTAITAYGFERCIGITGVTIPDSVTTINILAFARCTGITEIVIPDSVTAIYADAFSRCTAMTTCVLPQYLERMSSTFYGCTSLESITIPASVTYIGGNAFIYCSNLTDIWFLSEAAPTFPDDHTTIFSTGTETAIHTFGWGTDDLFTGHYDANTTISLETISNLGFSSDPGADGVYAFV